jgi:D-alanine-D-alanine ligase
MDFRGNPHETRAHARSLRFDTGSFVLTATFPPLRITDPAAFGRVAVLMGGTSSERAVSLDSGRNVLDALRARGVAADAVDGIPNLLRELQDKQFDRVFHILHGHNGGGEDGILQGLLEALRVPYTGSGVLGSALSMDKIRSKQVWLSLGLPTPRYVRLAGGERRAGGDVHAAARELGLPVIIKPSCEGSSVGVSRVFTDADLDDAIALAAKYPGELLMEQMIQGDELTVGILGDVALPSIRIVPKGQWYDYHAKYVAEDTQYLCPGLDGVAEDEIRRIALEAFLALDCSGWGRVDVMRDRDSGRFSLLEVNTAPGMTSHSLVPKAAREMGIDFEELCWRILEMTVEARG